MAAMTMCDFDLRQRIQTSEFNEGRLLIQWINSLEVAERLADPGLAIAPSGTCIIQSQPWAIYRTPSVATNAMTASIFLAERNEADTFLTVAVKHPSYSQSLLPASCSISGHSRPLCPTLHVLTRYVTEHLAVIMRMSVSNDILRACAPTMRKMLAHHLVLAITRALATTAMISIRGPLLTAHPVSNQQLYRRDAWLEETFQGKLRHREVLFTYGF
ncbi:hypothetical protein PIIN_01519 [Serendipita indica DSM 11827]|uniref:Uncharacterized protein n=1 Tax=Serendipita indica (strain DSM 11827) TaxID=1109443 RepID=G4T8P0_SERID|nr:hypothetical protein PIIN_01519 [Serendipita indica DSM 11827]